MSAPVQREKRVGYIEDYISGTEVKATPEEIDAVQVFAWRLVEDYDYDKAQVQTRPQFRVRKRPSDEERSYPVDIAVFRNTRKIEEALCMVVECKKNRGESGLQERVGSPHDAIGRSPSQKSKWY